MDSSVSFIKDLANDYGRLGRLLEVIDGGRWWTREQPGRGRIEELDKQASFIRAATDEIERIVGQLGN